ncbi:ribonuclease D [Pasteurellaceae bacterium LIM206]|nr:ribonuclease D [Pasteurellaceae bacterium LIM206]
MTAVFKEIKNSPSFQLITSDQALSEACRQARTKSTVALDTEFIRIRSYYPKLGLIQLYDGEEVSLIDPMSITDFTPFVELLADQRVMKVLHACSEDLEVFQHSFNQLPNPLSDTQIMADFLGFGNSTGFAALIRHYFGLQLDKGLSRTDWLKRPLSDKQLQYAAADVWYLLPLYQQMQTALAQTSWQSAVLFDCVLLAEKRLEVKAADKAYLNIPNAWRLQPRELMRLKLLAEWRQEEAIKRDLALNFVVKGENLWLVAKNAPKHNSELLAMGLSPQEVRIHGKRMLHLVEQANKIDEQDFPPMISRLADDPRYKKTLKALQQKLKEITPSDLNSDVISSKRSLESFIKWVWLKQKDPTQLPDLMRDWREPFGKALLDVM